MTVSYIAEARPSWQGSSVYFSKFYLDSLWKRSTTPGIAIKYVITGVENYTHDNTTAKVGAGEYLLLNKEKDFEVSIDYARDPVVGLCINISENIVNEVLYNFQNDERFLLDNPFYNESKSLDLFESVFKKDDVLGMHLESLVPFINESECTLNISDSELYYGIANKLLASQNIISKEILGIRLQRLDIKKELYRRLLLGKRIMDDSSDHCKISEVAAAAALSEFHFFRTFRQAFGISPHQYQLKVKLQKAASLLEDGKSSVEDVAYECGFTDVFAFSKTFKKHFNIPPSFYKKGFGRNNRS